MNLMTGDDVVDAVVDSARRRRTELLELRKGGKTNAEIARMFGISRQRVHVLIKRARKDRKRA